MWSIEIDLDHYKKNERQEIKLFLCSLEGIKGFQESSCLLMLGK